MSKLPESKSDCLLERQAWEDIIKSEDFSVFKKLLKSHCEYLQKEVNDLLRTQKYTEAYGKLIALDDSNKILTLITIRISELNERGK